MNLANVCDVEFTVECRFTIWCQGHILMKNEAHNGDDGNEAPPYWICAHLADL